MPMDLMWGVILLSTPGLVPGCCQWPHAGGLSALPVRRSLSGRRSDWPTNQHQHHPWQRKAHPISKAVLWKLPVVKVPLVAFDPATSAEPTACHARADQNAPALLAFAWYLAQCNPGRPERQSFHSPSLILAKRSGGPYSKDPVGRLRAGREWMCHSREYRQNQCWPDRTPFAASWFYLRHWSRQRTATGQTQAHSPGCQTTAVRPCYSQALKRSVSEIVSSDVEECGIESLIILWLDVM